MSRQCDLYWNEITSHQYNFDRENIEVEELRKLTIDDLKQFFNVKYFFELFIFKKKILNCC